MEVERTVEIDNGGQTAFLDVVVLEVGRRAKLLCDGDQISGKTISYDGFLFQLVEGMFLVSTPGGKAFSLVQGKKYKLTALTCDEIV